MPTKTRTVRFTADIHAVIDEDDGSKIPIPEGWALLPPGDPGLTRRVKAAGPCWSVVDRVGRKTFSHGVYAPREVIEAAKADLEIERQSPSYTRKLESGRKRREEKQERYVGTFRDAVVRFLAFHERHKAIESRLADAVTAHATPVGSGTVARTERISVEERAEAAVIAWMRHQTTAYDDLVIPRVAGERRRVRRMLAERSRSLLEGYRTNTPPRPGCPLARALPSAPETD